MCKTHSRLTSDQKLYRICLQSYLVLHTTWCFWGTMLSGPSNTEDESIHTCKQVSNRTYVLTLTIRIHYPLPNPSQENLISRLGSRWTQHALLQLSFLTENLHWASWEYVYKLSYTFPILQYGFPLLPIKNPCWHFHQGLPVVSSTDSPRMGHMTTKLPGYMPDMSKLVTAMNLNLATLSCILQIKMVKKMGWGFS